MRRNEERHSLEYIMNNQPQFQNGWPVLEALCIDYDKWHDYAYLNVCVRWPEHNWQHEFNGDAIYVWEDENEG